MCDAREPLFSTTVEQKFRALAEKMLQWKQENEDDRQKSPAAAKS
jgi:hypothetical protein